MNLKFNKNQFVFLWCNEKLSTISHLKKTWVGKEIEVEGFATGQWGSGA